MSSSLVSNQKLTLAFQADTKIFAQCIGIIRTYSWSFVWRTKFSFSLVLTTYIQTHVHFKILVNTQRIFPSYGIFFSYSSLYLGILYDRKPSNNNFCLVGFCEYSFLGSRNWRIIIIPGRKLSVYTCTECHCHSKSFRLRWDEHFFRSIYVFSSIAL